MLSVSLCSRVLLRTIPTNSRGVAHILEHSTLCGSQRYPCRNVFFSMLPRSLATFINAFTGDGYTQFDILVELGARTFLCVCVCVCVWWLGGGGGGGGQHVYFDIIMLVFMVGSIRHRHVLQL